MELMKTPLSFTVTVTGCNTCPHGMRSSGICFIADLPDRVTIFKQNYFTLTQSCPMIIKQKGEKCSSL